MVLTNCNESMVLSGGCYGAPTRPRAYSADNIHFGSKSLRRSGWMSERMYWRINALIYQRRNEYTH